MKTSLLLLFGTVLIMAACQQTPSAPKVTDTPAVNTPSNTPKRDSTTSKDSKETTAKDLFKQAIDLRNELLPKQAQLVELKKELTERVVKLDPKKQAALVKQFKDALNDVAAQTDQMTQWMADLKPNWDDYKAMSEDKLMGFFTGKLHLGGMMRGDFANAIEAAQSLLK